MRPNPSFVNQRPEFWANVRTISQEIGYTARGKGTVKVPTLLEVRSAFTALNLSTRQLVDRNDHLTPLGKRLFKYFQYRASILNSVVEKLLMDKAAAKAEFTRLKRDLHPTCPLPMNKQKGNKRNYAFFTGMINMLLESAIGDRPCDYDPRSLTTVTANAFPLRTLSRRVDGAFPSVVDPIAIWEIKEYYYTTTFGSRVADGVYETLLDGMELSELEHATGRRIDHVLFVDDYFTWWECGRSYLCRLIDMLHMGHVDEVIFGREVISRLPTVAAGWLKRQQR